MEKRDHDDSPDTSGNQRNDHQSQDPTKFPGSFCKKTKTKIKSIKTNEKGRKKFEKFKKTVKSDSIDFSLDRNVEKSPFFFYFFE